MPQLLDNGMNCYLDLSHPIGAPATTAAAANIYVDSTGPSGSAGVN